jgi:hypothetical protein
VEAPDATMAASTIMWLDEANKTVEFEPVGTHPDYRRRGLGKAMLLHGMHLALAAGALMPRSPAWVRRDIPRRAGCTTASGSASSRGTRRSSKPNGQRSPRAPARSSVAGDDVVVDQERAGRAASALDQLERVGHAFLEQASTTPDYPGRDEQPHLVNESGRKQRLGQ